MTALVTCVACQHGDHANHTEVVEALSDEQIAEGFCGGKVCPCDGECENQTADQPTEYTGDIDLEALKAVVEQAISTKGSVQIVIGINEPSYASIRCLPSNSEYGMSVNFDLVPTE